jgi:hypothetical protein
MSKEQWQKALSNLLKKILAGKTMNLNLQILNDKYAICKFNTDSDIPDSIKDSDFYSVTRTKDELSVVCKQSGSLNNCEINENWRILKVAGSLDLSLIGIIAEISGILRDNKIPIFTISTFETDYILVKSKNLNRAVDSLKAKGHEIT